MKTHAESSDQALAALALVASVEQGSAGNVRTLLATTPNIQLLAGMVTLVTSLRVSLAAACGVGVPEIDQHLRELLHVHGQKEDRR